MSASEDNESVSSIQEERQNIEDVNTAHDETEISESETQSEDQQQQEVGNVIQTEASVEEASAMSPEHTLLLQVLRRAKRQQDLIIQVQKSLRTLVGIEKSVGRAAEQIKQLQSAVRETQRQIVQTQKQVAAVEKTQSKGFQKIANQRGLASKPKKVLGKRKKRAESRRKGR